MWLKKKKKHSACSACACNSEKQSDCAAKALVNSSDGCSEEKKNDSTNFSVHSMFPKPADLVRVSKALVTKVTLMSILCDRGLTASRSLVSKLSS